MQVPREGEHEAHHVVGDHVGVKSPHVAQPARMLDERVEHVMFETCRCRLHPAQLLRVRQENRRDLAEKGLAHRQFPQARRARRAQLTTVIGRAASRMSRDGARPRAERERASSLSPDRLGSRCQVALSDFATRKKTFGNVLALKMRARQNGRRRVDNEVVCRGSGPVQSVEDQAVITAMFIAASRRRLSPKAAACFVQVPLQSSRNQEAAQMQMITRRVNEGW